MDNDSNSSTTSTMSTNEEYEYCLNWKNHQSNMLTVFEQMFQTEALTDVTLACADGGSVKCHQMVLAACSPYFQKLLMKNPCPHPIVILVDIGESELRALLEYMYKGSVSVGSGQLARLVKAAEALKVKGMVQQEEEVERDKSNERRTDSPVLHVTHTPSPALSSPSQSSPSIPTPPNTNRPFSSPKMDRFDCSTDFGIANLMTDGLQLQRSWQPAAPFKKQRSTPPPSELECLRLASTSTAAFPVIPFNGISGLTLSSPPPPIPMQVPIKHSPSPTRSHTHFKRNYKRYTMWDLSEAIHEVRAGKTALQAARKFGIPSRTLYDKVKKLGNPLSTATATAGRVQRRDEEGEDGEREGNGAPESPDEEESGEL